MIPAASGATLGFGRPSVVQEERPNADRQEPATILQLLDAGQFFENSIITDFSFMNEDEFVVSKLNLQRFATVDGYPTSDLFVLRLPTLRLENALKVRESVTSIAVSCDRQWIAAASIKNKPEQPTGEVQLWRPAGNEPSKRINWEPRTVGGRCEYDSTGKRPLWLTAQKLQFSADSSTLFAYAPTLCEVDLSGRWDPSVRWLTGHGHRRWRVDAANGRVTLAVGTSVRIMDLDLKREVGKVVHSYEREQFVTPSISELNLSVNGMFIYSMAGHPFAGYLNDIQVWDIDRSVVLMRKFVDAGTTFPRKEWIGKGTVQPNGKLVAYVVNSPCFGEDDKLLDSVALEIRVEEVATQKVVGSIPLAGTRVLKLGFSPSGQYLAVLLGSRQVDLFDYVPETRADWKELAKSSSLRLIHFRN